MQRNIVIEDLKEVLPWKMKVEMVERKGIGHPDTLADGIAESVSVALCKEYLKRYGALMHHNTDQCEIVGGEVNVSFGGGEIIRPIKVILSGRATTVVDNDFVPIHEIAIKATHEFLEANLPNLDIEDGVSVESVMGRGSADLVNVFKRSKVPLSNDTSFGVGFAPLTTLEKMVLETETFLNSRKFKKNHRFLGEDIKVMGMRLNKEYHMTIAAAFISKYVLNAEEYLTLKEEIKAEVNEFLSSICDGVFNVYVNTGDNDNGKSASDFYLTITGTSAEMGDDGSVGRGNRVSGLITPCRPMSMEAAAGKNPYNHVGKIYNVLSFKIANRIVDEVAGVNDVVVRILSQIGKRIDYPKIASVQISGNDYDPNKVRKIVDEELETITQITMDIVNGKYRLF